MSTETLTWPEWLTPEYAKMHRAIKGEIKAALQHCYESADAAGMDWTMDGWISCSASNILSALKRAGSPPPDLTPNEFADVPHFEIGHEFHERLDEDEYEEHHCPDESCILRGYWGPIFSHEAKP